MFVLFGYRSINVIDTSRCHNVLYIQETVDIIMHFHSTKMMFNDGIRLTILAVIFC